jgi:hypothetical protein
MKYLNELTSPVILEIEFCTIEKHFQKFHNIEAANSRIEMEVVVDVNPLESQE